MRQRFLKYSPSEEKNTFLFCSSLTKSYFCNEKPQFFCIMCYAMLVNDEAAGSGWLETMPAHDVVVQVDETDMIDGPTPDPSLVERESIYDLSGRKLPALQKGINIIRMSNGTIRKMIAK